MSSDYFWVIGGGLLQIPLIAEVRDLGLRVVVSDSNPSCAARSHADVFYPVSIFDIPGHLACATRFIDEGYRIAGVLAAGIDAPETMAVLAKHLGLRSVDAEIARIVNNKDKFREHLGSLGYPVPRFRVIDNSNLPSVAEFADAVRYPLIVKNTDSSGSRGTTILRIRDDDEIRRAVEAAMAASRSGRALIEELWDGPEMTVETIFDVDGRFHRCFITDRFFDWSKGYALETGLRQPSALAADVQEDMYALAEHVARDMGINIGAAKYDMMLTRDGPRIIEMTVRLSGGFDCQYLVPAATGKNVLKAAVLTALGVRFPDSLLQDTKHRIGLSESIWPKPGKIKAIWGLDEARAVPGCEHIFLRYKVGDVVEPYTDCTKRVCFVLVTGADELEAKRTMERVKSLVHIEVA